ncbi:hypothetical protein HS041_22595 [Planomonospora sp. ID67723]|uniref:hypothetical protein n=1 Tax=Planomonospora sp. ID67723 TaxID=2738134 RepID=UPI0018C41084|nr:hypothetical protein [Planomonospora sp. ID67723]MBG0830555.1 hypothetical protein [Planomonospora sp. ID67723]
MARRTLSRPVTRNLLLASVALWGATIALAVTGAATPRIHLTLLAAGFLAGFALVIGRALITIQDLVTAVLDAIDGATDDLKSTLGYQQGVAAGARAVMGMLLGGKARTEVADLTHWKPRNSSGRVR